MAQDFSWTTSAGKYLELYKKLLESSGSPASRDAYPKERNIPGRKIREGQVGTEPGNGEK
jgi:hypothetical protein